MWWCWLQVRIEYNLYHRLKNGIWLTGLMAVVRMVRGTSGYAWTIRTACSSVDHGSLHIWSTHEYSCSSLRNLSSKHPTIQPWHTRIVQSLESFFSTSSHLFFGLPLSLCPCTYLYPFSAFVGYLSSLILYTCRKHPCHRSLILSIMFRW